MTQTGLPALLPEVERYLELVELLRAEGREPCWRIDHPAERALIENRRQT